MIKYASLVVLSLERPDVLRWSLESLMANTGYPHELIVHDDGSMDAQVRDFLHVLLMQGRISQTVLNPPGRNTGIGNALARTLPMCTGDYIAILGGDYQYRACWLQEAVEILRVHSKVSIVSLARSSDNNFDRHTFVRYQDHTLGQRIELRWSPGTGAIAFRREDLEAVWPIPYLNTARAEQWTVIKALFPEATRDVTAMPACGHYPEKWCVSPGEPKVAHPPINKLQGIFGVYDKEGNRHRRPAHRLPLLHGCVDLTEEEALWVDTGVPLRCLGNFRGNRFCLTHTASIGGHVLPPPLYGVPDWSF